MRHILLASAAALVLLPLAAETVQAQRSPSADQIMRSLAPTGRIDPTGRGIRPAAPAQAPTASQATAQPAAPVAAAPHAAPAQAATRAPAAAAAATAAAAAPVAPAAAPSIDLTVQFQMGSAELTPDAMRTLDELGKALSSEMLAPYRFRIEGHTDTTGTPEMNLALSQARAARVAEYLQSKFGVAGGRLEPVGRGQEALRVKTPEQTPEPRNRRVQIINVGT